MTHFKFINPLPKNTEEVLRRYKNIVIVEQSMGQFAQFISGQISGLNIFRYNKVEGQPLKVEGIVDFVNQILNGSNK